MLTKIAPKSFLQHGPWVTVFWWPYGQQNLGAHFMNHFSTVFQIWWKFYAALGQIVLKLLLWNFDHSPTAELSWYLHKFVTIRYTIMDKQWKQFPSNFNYDGKFFHAMGPRNESAWCSPRSSKIFFFHTGRMKTESIEHFLDLSLWMSYIIWKQKYIYTWMNTDLHWSMWSYHIYNLRKRQWKLDKNWRVKSQQGCFFLFRKISIVSRITVHSWIWVLLPIMALC